MTPYGDGETIADRSPMDVIMSDMRGRSSEFKLSDVVREAQMRGVNGSELLNFSNTNCSGMEFDAAGVDMIHSDARVGEGAKLNVAGANLTGCTFKPASVCNDIIFNLCDANALTKAQNMTFSGFYEEGAEVAFKDMNVSGLSIDGHPANPTCNMHMQLDNCIAKDMNIADSRYTEINAKPATDMSGLNANNARALSMHLDGCRMDGATIRSASFAPDFSARNASVVGTDFSYSALGNANFEGAIAYGASFEGCEIGNCNMQGMKAFPADLIGARMNGKEITNVQMANELGGQLGIAMPQTIEAERAATQQLAQVQQRAMTDPAPAATPSEWNGQNIPLTGTDQLIAAMEAGALHGKALRSDADRAADQDVYQNIASGLAATRATQRESGGIQLS